MEKNKKTKRQECLNSAFHDFKVSISTQIIERYAGAYQTYNTLGNKWRDTLEYRPHIEANLIKATNTFLRVLHDKQIHGEKIYFLDSLTSMMADYLANYTCRAPKVESHKDAYIALKDKLFTNSEYIAFLREKGLRRKARRREYALQKKTGQPVSKPRAQQAFAIHIQVLDIFAEAQNMRGRNR